MSVKCRYCGKEIHTRKDLVVGMMIFSISPYHSACFAQQWKESILLRRQSINGRSGNFSAVLLPVFGILWLLALLSAKVLSPFFIILVVVFIAIGPAIRMYSYYKYEKPLKD